MRKITMMLTGVAFVLGALAISAGAQTQSLGAASFHAQLQNATPIVTKAACNGGTGVRGCGGGYYWACGPYGNCRCVHC